MTFLFRKKDYYRGERYGLSFANVDDPSCFLAWPDECALWRDPPLLQVLYPTVAFILTLSMILPQERYAEGGENFRATLIR